jgi:hypothetical protein
LNTIVKIMEMRGTKGVINFKKGRKKIFVHNQQCAEIFSEVGFLSIGNLAKSKKQNLPDCFKQFLI